ncbi:MAG TPA: S-methyl-5'-thioadenosine phosphorylase, partial [Limnochorda sp.]
TPYGEITVQTGRYHGHQIAFMPRHGKGHSIPPHKINYRANIWGLKALGVQRILATAAVGSLNPAMEPGHFVFVDQFLDFTKGRASTFFDGDPYGVVHIDMSEPYCPRLRDALTRVGQRLGLKTHSRGVYVCTEGPRFETPAEIRAFAMLGGDVVGMTGVPEVVLAREAGLCYATMAMVTNLGAGLSKTPLTQEEVVEIMAANTQRVRQLAMETIACLPRERSCICGDA